MRGFSRIGSVMLGAIGAIGLLGADISVREPPTPRRRYSNKPTSYGGGRSRTTLQKTTGDRECERRRRQIATGSLRHENGLDASVPAMGLTIRKYRHQEKEARAGATEAWLEAAQ